MLFVENNKKEKLEYLCISEAERTEEELKLLLHTECETDFLPQDEPEPVEDGEATAINGGEEEYASFA